ncbi:hypothetical protein JOF56_001642 [Kibdelosporangium banguiense]|uniref:LytR/CpsA/Psr regulator C-terminal domain-containing protein n=1 Tax=Kibdelosporangium banguiense TaxID=1365924 RepID=A0ABS4TA09_9PSEU|nr:LytR C-terminal domain-containing protein [Kibdelosporangium banguiense]MBP2321257.1 hypothetical protein [Kibdelosporangium banguiense]
MTTPEQAGPTRPARLAGLALLALALIALVIGLISLFGGGDSDPGASPPPSSKSQPPPPPASDTSSAAPPPSSAQPPPVTTTTTSTPAPPPASQPAQPPAQNNRSEPVRVYNNSTITGLADRAANDFRGNGWNVAAVDNYSSGIIPTTTVYFRPGTAEEAQAKDLAKTFGLRAEPRFQGIQDAGAGIIVIVTKEYNPKSK